MLSISSILPYKQTLAETNEIMKQLNAPSNMDTHQEVAGDQCVTCRCSLYAIVDYKDKFTRLL